ncbi:MAG: 30S ribosome-binding factor RbfA [Chloroflexi bacterium]|uniref:Ribosome-binding factor A n=1 Tax=Candidatus Chlorohelix allophototropha TaxID=3003348 RepID=A0A8T7M780_9CHLR|nr:30S ribosome-binding factor RbfA [Chloroflexota bacterium]WJW69707.1 30S ribosome-binding factor RbfA [Chloroflexota bacterium L227-S17]
MSRRTEQVAEMIKEIVSTLIQRELRDPRLGFVTITRVEVSPDLKHAKLLFSVMGTEEARKDTFKALKGASGYLRRELFHQLQMKYVPELHFEFDGGIEHGDKIQRILQAIEQEEKQNQPPETKES